MKFLQHHTTEIKFNSILEFLILFYVFEISIFLIIKAIMTNFKIMCLRHGSILFLLCIKNHNFYYFLYYFYQFLCFFSKKLDFKMSIKLFNKNATLICEILGNEYENQYFVHKSKK